MLTPSQISLFQKKLLAWYDAEGRTLPWRYKGTPADPYKVWISEIMLQQTTVGSVMGYFHEFTSKWPTLQDLASAPLDDVLHAWQGLGYYGRGRRLHAAARMIVSHYGGRLPSTEKELLSLPGVGPYTAASVAAIAFDRPAVVVDGNIERIIARLYKVESPLPKAKKEIYSHAGNLSPVLRPGDYAQALMDLGSTICKPRVPLCSLCPVSSFCAAKDFNPEQYPLRAASPMKPTRYTTFYWIEDGSGRVLLFKRAPTGLLGGMMGFPSTLWEALAPDDHRASFTHTFTHFHLKAAVIIKKKEDMPEGLFSINGPEHYWVQPRDFGKFALPSLMKKVVKYVHESALA